MTMTSTIKVDDELDTAETAEAREASVTALAPAIAATKRAAKASPAKPAKKAAKASGKATAPGVRRDQAIALIRKGGMTRREMAEKAGVSVGRIGELIRAGAADKSLSVEQIAANHASNTARGGVDLEQRLAKATEAVATIKAQIKARDAAARKKAKASAAKATKTTKATKPVAEEVAS